MNIMWIFLYDRSKLYVFMHWIIQDKPITCMLQDILSGHKAVFIPLFKYFKKWGWSKYLGHPSNFMVKTLWFLLLREWIVFSRATPLNHIGVMWWLHWVPTLVCDYSSVQHDVTIYSHISKVSRNNHVMVIHNLVGC